MKRLGGFFFTAVFALAFASPASATTFCVPNFHAACPNNGINVAQADLEVAMQSDATDAIADRIVVAAGVHTNSNSFTTAGTDSLEIVGAGPGLTAAATRLTTSSSGNIFVMNLAGGSRSIAVRDLTIVVPGTIPDDEGVGAQARQATFSNVDVESAVNEHQGGIDFLGGGTFEDGAFYGVSGGTHGFAVGVNPTTPGTLNVRRTVISQIDNGVSADAATIPVNLSRVRITAPAQTGATASNGGVLTVENSIVTDPGVMGIGAVANSSLNASAAIRHTTIARVIGPVGVNPVSSQVLNAAGNGSTTTTATGLIVRGFSNAYFRSAPVSMAIGDAALTMTYSNFGAGVSSGDGTLTQTPGNINQDPLFTSSTDFRLLAGSPSIDTADPAPAVALTEDFDGSFRPCDGDGNGSTIRDMGAFERQVAGCPPPVVNPPGPPVQPGTPVTKTALKKCKKPKKKGKKAAAAKKRKKCRK